MPTTTRGFRYPDPADRLNQGAAAIANLAADVDSYVGTVRARGVGYFPGSPSGTDYTFTSNGFVLALPLVLLGGVTAGGVTVASSSRMTVPTTGVYRVSAAARVGFATGTAPAAASSVLAMSITRSGTDTVCVTYEPAALNASLEIASKLHPLTAGDYLELRVTGLNNAILKLGDGITYLTMELA